MTVANAMIPQQQQNSIDEQLQKLPTTSSKIRFLHKMGFAKAHIALILDIRYQWVRNVLVTPVKGS